jgi:hypothetical protein
MQVFLLPGKVKIAAVNKEIWDFILRESTFLAKH